MIFYVSALESLESKETVCLTVSGHKYIRKYRGKSYFN